MSEPYLEFPLDLPAYYRIYVTGAMDSNWVKRHWGLTADPVDSGDELVQTMLVGEVSDQAALIGVFNALYNMGHTVVSVERISPDIYPKPVGSEEEA